MSMNKLLFHIPVKLIEKEIQNKSNILTERHIEGSNRIIFFNNSQSINSQRSQKTNNIEYPN